jgi:hypothetical protein
MEREQLGQVGFLVRAPPARWQARRLRTCITTPHRNQRIPAVYLMAAGTPLPGFEGISN